WRAQVCTLDSPASADPATISPSSTGRPVPNAVARAIHAVMPPVVPVAITAAYQVRARVSRQDSHVLALPAAVMAAAARPVLPPASPHSQCAVMPTGARAAPAIQGRT